MTMSGAHPVRRVFGSDRPWYVEKDQPSTYIELFFDLVFVYAVTQLVSFLAADLTWRGAGRVVLLCWLVWWAWTQFTWALNSADTTHPWVEVATLAAAGAAFFMAITLPQSYGADGLIFAAMYASVRVIGLSVYLMVSRTDGSKRHAVLRFAALSALGLVAVLAGGTVEGGARTACWALAVAFDLVAAWFASREEGWDLRPDHFAERHALFLIIMLGESLIVAASSLSAPNRSTELVVVGALVAAVTTGMWWCYYSWLRERLLESIAEHQGVHRARLAQRIYSLLHFVAAFGVLLVAVSVKVSLKKPEASPTWAATIALVGGLALYLLGLALALALAEGAVRPIRIIAVSLFAAAAVALHSQPVGFLFAAAVVMLAAVSFVELAEHPSASADGTFHLELDEP